MIAHLYQEGFDGTHELRQLVCEGEQAVVEARLTGKHIGEFAGICPTGREVIVPYVAMYRLAHGLIEEIRLYAPGNVLQEHEAEVQEVEHAEI